MKETLQINLPKGSITFDKTKHLNLLCYGNDAVSVSASLIDILKVKTKDTRVKYIHDMPDGILSAIMQGYTDLDMYENVPPILQKIFVTDDYISSAELTNELVLFRAYRDIDGDVCNLFDNIDYYRELLCEYFAVPAKYKGDDWDEAEYFFKKLKSYCQDYENKHIFYIVYISEDNIIKILQLLKTTAILGIHFILLCDKVGIISEELLEYYGLYLITKSDCSDELYLIERTCNDNTNKN